MGFLRVPKNQLQSKSVITLWKGLNILCRYKRALFKGAAYVTVNSYKLIGTTGHLTSWARCRINIVITGFDCKYIQVQRILIAYRFITFRSKISLLFFSVSTALVCLRVLIVEVSRSHSFRNITIRRTPLDEWSARHRSLCLTTRTTITRDIYPCCRRESNTQSQASERRIPTP
jgi:hypothetical protein